MFYTAIAFGVYNISTGILITTNPTLINRIVLKVIPVLMGITLIIFGLNGLNII